MQYLQTGVGEKEQHYLVSLLQSEDDDDDDNVYTESIMNMRNITLLRHYSLRIRRLGYL